MGVFDRLRTWFRHRFDSDADGGRSGAAAAGASTETGGADGYECAICGTAVDAADASCPVCRSGDVVPAGEGTSSAASSGPSTRRYVEDTDDDAVHRLQQVRTADGILAGHEDRWEELDAGYRVETPDGEVTVTSRVEVAALVEEHHQ